MKNTLPAKPSCRITTARSYFSPEDISFFQSEAAKVLEGRVSMGPWVEKFQDAAKSAHKTKYALATNSCTSALEIALLAVGVRPGDHVIVPVETFVATGMAVHNIGATPVFADVRKETLCLDPAELERLGCERVKAVILVHFGGVITPDVGRIEQLCRKNGWALIEDAAHAHGAKYDGRPIGAFGQAACLSYYPTKLLTAGEGGMVLTNDQNIAAICKSYQLRGQDSSLPGEQFVRPYGRNIRLPELSALLGVLQYQHLAEFTANRRATAAIYDEVLSTEPSIYVPSFPDECFHNYWLYTTILPSSVDRELLKKRMSDEWQIDVSWSYFPSLHLMPVFRDLYSSQPGQLPVAEEILARTLCLPIHPLIGADDARSVAQCFLHECRKFF